MQCIVCGHVRSTVAKYGVLPCSAVLWLSRVVQGTACTIIPLQLFSKHVGMCAWSLSLWIICSHPMATAACHQAAPSCVDLQCSCFSCYEMQIPQYTTLQIVHVFHAHCQMADSTCPIPAVYGCDVSKGGSKCCYKAKDWQGCLVCPASAARRWQP